MVKLKDCESTAVMVKVGADGGPACDGTIRVYMPSLIGERVMQCL
jgi:hypothetical protein